MPPADDIDPILNVTEVYMTAGWTTISFLKNTAPLDDLDGQDYDLATVSQRHLVSLAVPMRIISSGSAY